MQSRRHVEILRILGAEGQVSNARLAEALGVSSETVRRDVRKLAEGGTVLRMHGGVGLPGEGVEAPFRARMRENAAAKQAIARAFAGLVQSGDSLMLDTGTTTSFVARALVHHRRLTVVTNSTDIARTLAGGEGNRVFLAGGAVRADSGAVLGSEAVRFVAGFTVGFAVISAGGLMAGEVMDFDPDEAELARAVLARGARKVLVSDASKFGRRGLVSVCAQDTLDLMVTDRTPPDCGVPPERVLLSNA